jgi:hypothetical protein
MGGEENINLVAAELQEERAGAYFRITKKMEEAVSAYKIYAAEVDRMSAPSAEMIQRRQELRETAAELVWFFVIQREILRLPMYEGLFQEYGIPEEVKKWMGPKGVLGTRDERERWKT